MCPVGKAGMWWVKEWRWSSDAGPPEEEEEAEETGEEGDDVDVPVRAQLGLQGYHVVPRLLQSM